MAVPWPAEVLQGPWPGEDGGSGPALSLHVPPMAEKQGLLQLTTSPALGGTPVAQGLCRVVWEGSRTYTPTLGSLLALCPQLREAAVLRMVVEAEEVEGVHLKVPLWAQPPSVTEQSTDLHYGFPGNFPGREEGRP